MFGRNNKARMERNQQRLDSGLVSTHFPEVAGIVIKMIYKQAGIAKPINRIMNFSPRSYAFFKVDCLSDNCVDGGFDLTQIIDTMISSHRMETQGELDCEGSRAVHSAISYEVAIEYA